MNKQKNKKKVIAFLLSMLMLISLFQNISYTPIAEGGETESVASESDANFATGQQSLGTQENQNGVPLEEENLNETSQNVADDSVDLSLWNNAYTDTSNGITMNFTASVKHNGQETDLDQVTKVFEGDEFNLKYKWELDNSAIPRDGNPIYIKVNFNDLNNLELISGKQDIMLEGKKVGYIYISNGYAYICLDNQTFLTENTRKGDGTIYGNVKLTETDKGSGDKITIGTAKKKVSDVIYDDGTATSTLTVQKATDGKATYDKSTNTWKQSYKLTLKTTGSVSGVSLTDSLGANLKNISNIKIASSNDSNVTANTIYGSFGALANALNKLGSSDGSTTTVEVTYDVETDEGIFDPDNANSTSYTNTVDYTYKNNKKETKTGTTSATYDVTRPEVKKTGSLDKTSKVVTWTITIDLKDYAGEYTSLDALLGSGTIVDMPEIGSALCDKDGNLQGGTSQTLPASAFKENNGVYTATVYTKVTDNYMDSATKLDVKNDVTLTTDKGYKYMGTGTVQTPGKDWTIEKHAVKIQDGYIYWTVSVKDIPEDLTNVYIKDNMQKYWNNPGSMSGIYNTKITFTRKDNSTFAVDATDSNDANIENEYVIYTPDTAGNNGGYDYKFEFKDSLFTGSSPVKEITLEYKTKVLDTDLNQVQRNFKNVATIYYSANGKEESKSGEDIYKNPLPPLNKTVTAKVDETGKISYMLDVSLNSMALSGGESVTIADTLPTDMKLSSSMITAYFYVRDVAHNTAGKLSDMSYYAGGATIPNIGLQTSETNGIASFTIPVTADYIALMNAIDNYSAGTETHIRIEYTTEVTSLEDFAKKGSETFTNSAQLKIGSTNVGTPVSTTTTLKAPALVSKDGVFYGTYDNTTGADNSKYNTAEYTIEVNKGAYDLVPGDGKLTAVDKLGTAFSYNMQSIKVYEVNGGTETPLTSGTDYTVSYDGSSNSLRFELPDSKYLKITYTTRCNLKFTQGNSSITLTDEQSSNTFTLNGYQADQGGSKTFQGQVFTKGQHEAESNYGSIELYKYWTDAAGTTHALKDSTFRLYEATYDSATGTMTRGNLVRDTDVLKVTDEVAGKLTIDRLNYDQIYELVEVSAAEGFDVRADSFYFVLKKSSNITIPNSYEGKTFTNDTGYNLPYENEKSTYYTGSYDFSATKQLDGTTAYASGNTYTFKNFAVEEVSADAANATKVKDITTGTTAGNTTGAITFADKVSYSSATAGDVGKHYYKVYEKSSGYTDVTTDTNYYILTVDVALDNATNPTKLVATCSKITKYNSAGTGTTASEVVFNNTTVTTTIQGTKSWVGDTTADRPASIQVKLYKLKQGGNENDDADWEQVGAVRTVDAASAWKLFIWNIAKVLSGNGY